jgi:hypothetical protein
MVFLNDLPPLNLEGNGNGVSKPGNVVTNFLGLRRGPREEDMTGPKKIA